VKDALGHGSNALSGSMGLSGSMSDLSGSMSDLSGSMSNGPAHGTGVRSALGIATANAWSEPMGADASDQAEPAGESSTPGTTSSAGSVTSDSFY
jgi:hypothetical protein